MDDYPVETIVIDSDDDDERRILKHCLDYGLSYHEYDNLPLGRKWNYGAKVARETDPDFLVIVGSDDVISTPTFDTLFQLMHQGYDYIGMLDLYFFHAGRGDIKYWPGYANNRTGEPVGCYRIFSRRALDRMDWVLWDDELNKYLDGSMTRRIKALPELRTVSVRLDEMGFALDIKAGQSISSYKSFQPAQEAGLLFAEELLHKHLPCHEAEAILALEYEGNVEQPDVPACMPWDNYKDGLDAIGIGVNLIGSQTTASNNRVETSYVSITRLTP